MENQVVVITGASAGIGRATALAFVAKGASVALLSRNKKRLEALQKKIERFGGKALALEVDISNYEDIEKATDTIEKELGSIDVWVNNAMVTVFSPFKKITPEEFDRVTKVNYLGTVYGTMAALKKMRKRNKGTIIQVGSALSYRGIPLQSAYCASKFAVRGFTDSLRTELMHEKKDIHITMVQLPGLNTPQFSWCRSHVDQHSQPVPPIYQPEVAARAICWASKAKRREIYVGSSAVATILLNKLAPGLVDYYLSLTGFESQFARIKIPFNRRDNLFKTVDGDYKSHGVFSKDAKSTSKQFYFEKIPFVHVLTNLLFAFTATLSMTPGFVQKLFQEGGEK